MPAITGVTRRDAVRAALGPVLVPLGQAQQTRDLRVALLSDTHISAEPDHVARGFNVSANLAKAVEAIRASPPQATVITGDLARLQGTPGDYVQLRKLLAPLDAPVAFCLGNHDDRENFAAVMGERPAGALARLEGKRAAVLQAGALRLILLDSLIVPNETPGFLGKAQRTWLEKTLAAGGGPAALFVHHTLDDGDNSLLDSDRLLRIAAKHKDVKAIFYGHSHAYRYDTYEGVHLVNIPALGYNFSDAHPVGWLHARFGNGGVDLTLRAIGGNAAENGRTRSLAWRG